jgi:hypothetical protein
MNRTRRRSPGERDRAVARLRAITIGTTIAGVAAVGGFGAVAAISYSGGSSDVITAAAVTTGTATTTDASGAATSTAATDTIQATPAPTATTATTSVSAHATTGGS